eukprot:7155304-Alexandrium_andersonii.AAC.1
MATASASAFTSAHLRAAARNPPQLLAVPPPPQDCSQEAPVAGLRGQTGSPRNCAQPLLVDTSPQAG